MDECNDQVASLLDELMEELQRSERETDYARRVASGRIRFFDFQGLSIPVEIGPDDARTKRAKKHRVRRGDGSEAAPIWKCHG